MRCCYFRNAENSPAEQSGLDLGDIIIELMTSKSSVRRLFMAVGDSQTGDKLDSQLLKRKDSKKSLKLVQSQGVKVEISSILKADNLIKNINSVLLSRVYHFSAAG